METPSYRDEIDLQTELLRRTELGHF